ncbi:hypothetical protein D3C86_1440180 [compost metagenome]
MITCSMAMPIPIMNNEPNAIPYCGYRPKAIAPIKFKEKAMSIDFFSPILSIMIPEGIDIMP